MSKLLHEHRVKTRAEVDVRPNLFIIGATKCATTSLHNWLADHPAFSMSRVKEPGFFLESFERHPAIQAPKRVDELELENYLKLFPSPEQATWRGESSTGYTHLPKRSGVVERLHAFNPDARIIYLVRDPAVRVISNYWWNVQYENERRPLLKAVKDDPSYRDISNYAFQLRPYMDRFGPQRVRVLVLEEVTRPGSTELNKLLEWLGVDTLDTTGGFNRDNVTPGNVVRPRSRWLDAIRYSATWDYFSHIVPSSIKEKLRQMNKKPVHRDRDAEQGLLKELRASQRDEVAELSGMLGRSFDSWSVES